MAVQGARRRGRRSGSRVGPRVGRFQWAATFSTSESSLASGAQVSADLLNPSGAAAGDEESHGSTVYRILGDIYFRSLTNLRAPLFEAGIIDINEDASAASVFPEPWDDPARWVWLKQAPTTEVTSNVDLVKPWDHWAVDVRRKIKLLQAQRELIIIFANRSTGDVSTIEFYFSLHTLIWVP